MFGFIRDPETTFHFRSALSASPKSYGCAQVCAFDEIVRSLFGVYLEFIRDLFGFIRDLFGFSRGLGGHSLGGYSRVRSPGVC